MKFPIFERVSLIMIALLLMIVGTSVGQNPPVAFKSMDIEVGTPAIPVNFPQEYHTDGGSGNLPFREVKAVSDVISISFRLADASGNETVSDGKLSILGRTYNVKKAKITEVNTPKTGVRWASGCGAPNKYCLETYEYTEHSVYYDNTKITNIPFNLTPAGSYRIPVAFETPDGRYIRSVVGRFSGDAITLRPILAYKLFNYGNLSRDAEVMGRTCTYSGDRQICTKDIYAVEADFFYAMEVYNESIQLEPSWQAPRDAKEDLIKNRYTGKYSGLQYAGIPDYSVHYEVSFDLTNSSAMINESASHWVGENPNIGNGYVFVVPKSQPDQILTKIYLTVDDAYGNQEITRDVEPDYVTGLKDSGWKNITSSSRTIDGHKAYVFTAENGTDKYTEAIYNEPDGQILVKVYSFMPKPEIDTLLSTLHVAKLWNSSDEASRKKDLSPTHYVVRLGAPQYTGVLSPNASTSSPMNNSLKNEIHLIAPIENSTSHLFGGASPSGFTSDGGGSAGIKSKPSDAVVARYPPSALALGTTIDLTDAEKDKLYGLNRSAPEKEKTAKDYPGVMYTDNQTTVMPDPTDTITAPDFAGETDNGGLGRVETSGPNMPFTIYEKTVNGKVGGVPIRTMQLNTGETEQLDSESASSQHLYSRKLPGGPLTGVEQLTPQTGAVAFIVTEPKGSTVGSTLIQEYDSLPLALRQAGGWISVTATTFASPDNAAISKTLGVKSTEIDTNYGKNKNDATILVVWNGVAIDRGQLAHELAYTLDGDEYAKSSSDEYAKAAEADADTFAEQQYVSDYAAESGKAYDGTPRKYSEDFAESVRQYVTDKDAFYRNFPHRAAYFTKLIGD